MKRLLSAILVLVAMLGLAACGKKDSAETAASPAAEQSATQEAPPAATAPEQAAPASSAEGDQTGPAPAQLSETADEPSEQPTQADSSTQPSLRLGGPASEPASRHFTEGTNYKRVVPAQRTDVPAGKIEIMEVFWYGCPHCYALDPAVESWRHKGKPDYVEFSRVPAMWGNIQKIHARVFYTAELLGKLEELHPKIFRAIHVEGNQLDTPDKIQAWFVAHGVSEADFKRTFSSFALENKLRRAEMIGRAYRIDAVPTFTINGKFTTGVGDAGGETQLFSLLNELATSEHGGH